MVTPEADSADKLATAEEEAKVCRAIEADLRLPEGSLTLFSPPQQCPGCSLCKAKRRETG
jgi:hypothetical protein